MRPPKNKKTKKKFQLRSIGRWFKFKYLQLIRAKGGPSMVALGFSIGLAVEMFTLPTAGLAFFLIFPLVYRFRASMAAALLGFVFGKVIYIPMSQLNLRVGDLMLPHGIRRYLLEVLPGWMDRFVMAYLNLFVGGIVVGIILGILVYFPVRRMLQSYGDQRLDKRRKRKEQQLIMSEAGR